MLWLFLSLSARAETFTLDNGATVVGLLAEYNMRGSCQISVTGGDLTGAIVTVPCERIIRFERDNTAPVAAAPAPAPAAVPEPVIEEVVVEALPEPMPLARPVDAPYATAEPAPEPEPAPEAEVVAAAQPEPAPEPEPEPAAEDEGMWASAPASEAAEVTEEPRPSIGGVVLPSLPNLRMLRRPSEEVPEGGEEL